MLVPVILSFFLYRKTQALENSLVWVSVFILFNGLILYIPQFFPTSNKDSRMLSRVEGLCMGLGGAVTILPGISGMGMAVSFSSICGLERSYGLVMALLMNLGIWVGLIVFDLLSVIELGMYGLSFGIILHCVIGGITAFAGAYLGIRVMRTIAQDKGYTFFSYYCWGVALFTFVLNLMA